MQPSSNATLPAGTGSVSLFEGSNPLSPATNGTGFPSPWYTLCGIVFLLVFITLSFMRLRAGYLRIRRVVSPNASTEDAAQELQHVVVNPSTGAGDNAHLPQDIVVDTSATAAPVTGAVFNGTALHTSASTATVPRPHSATLSLTTTQPAESAAPGAQLNISHPHQPPRTQHDRPRRPGTTPSAIRPSTPRPQSLHLHHETPHIQDPTPSSSDCETAHHRTSAPRPQQQRESQANIIAQVNSIAETIEEVSEIASDEEGFLNQCSLL